MLKRALCAAAAACLLAVASPALALAAAAEPSTTVSLPIGDWLADAATLVVSLAGAVLAWLIARLPAAIRPILQTRQAEQLLTKAIAYGVNAVAGAEKGKVLSVDVGNAVVAQAADYAVRHGPDWLTEWLGGPEQIAEKILARLDLVPVAHVSAAGIAAKIGGARLSAAAPAAAAA